MLKAQILCVCGAKQPNLLQEQEKLAGTSLQEGFAHIQALPELEIRPPNLRGNVDGQSRAQQQFGKAQHLFQEAVTKSVKIGNTKETRKCSSMTERWDLDRWSLPCENRTRRGCKIWDHIATTQDKSKDPKYKRTGAERQALWGGSRITNIDKTGRTAAVQAKPKYSLPSQLSRERSFAGGNPMPTSEKPEETHSTPKETSDEKTTNVNATRRTIGQDGAVPHPPGAVAHRTSSFLAVFSFSQL